MENNVRHVFLTEQTCIAFHQMKNWSTEFFLVLLFYSKVSSFTFIVTQRNGRRSFVQSEINTNSFSRLVYFILVLKLDLYRCSVRLGFLCKVLEILFWHVYTIYLRINRHTATNSGIFNSLTCPSSSLTVVKFNYKNRVTIIVIVVFAKSFYYCSLTSILTYESVPT